MFVPFCFSLVRLVSCWEIRNSVIVVVPCQITPAEFIQYYGNVSASIDDDDYFELMIRNAWHISGGEGWCANSTCRRVLVTHEDGSQSVEEIKNDIGMAADNKKAMMANLQNQGIKASSLDTTGNCDAETPSKTVSTMVRVRGWARVRIA